VVHPLPPSIQTYQVLSPPWIFYKKTKTKNKKTIERNEKEKHLKFEIVPG